MSGKNNSKNSKEIFKEQFNNDAFRILSTILDLQVELFSPVEFQTFSKYLSWIKHNPLLDLGCGNGTYAMAFRKEYPEIEVIAVDSNKELLKDFKNKLKNNNDEKIKISHWHAGNEPAPLLAKKCRSALLRLVLQDVFNPVAILRTLAEILPTESPVIIIEEDDSLFQIDPECAAFRRVIDIWEAYVVKHSVSSRHMGRCIPRMAQEAGLEVVDVHLLAHSNIRLGTERLMNFFKLSVELFYALDSTLFEEGEAKYLLTELDSFVSKHGRKCFFLYPQVVTIAKVI